MSVDHLALMRAGLIQQFRGLPNLDAFVHALGDQLNDVEEFFAQLLTLQTLELSVGVQLDRLGVLLGQGRNALSDSDYRTLLQTRIIQYQAQGTVEEIIQAILALSVTSVVQLTEVFPAAFQVVAVDLSNVVVASSDLKAAIFGMKLAGVGAQINQVSSPAFAFDTASAGRAGFDVGHLAGPF